MALMLCLIMGTNLNSTCLITPIRIIFKPFYTQYLEKIHIKHTYTLIRNGNLQIQPVFSYRYRAFFKTNTIDDIAGNVLSFKFYPDKINSKSFR